MKRSLELLNRYAPLLGGAFIVTKIALEHFEKVGLAHTFDFLLVVLKALSGQNPFITPEVAVQLVAVYVSAITLGYGLVRKVIALARG